MKKIVIKLIYSLVLGASLVSGGFLYQENSKLIAETTKLQEFQALANQLSLDKQQLTVDYQKLASANLVLNNTLEKANQDYRILFDLNSNLTKTIEALELEKSDLVLEIKNKAEEISQLNEKVRVMSLPPVFSGGGGGGYYVVPSIPTPTQNSTAELETEIETLRNSLEQANIDKNLLSEQLNNLNNLLESLELELDAANSNITLLNQTITNLETEKISLQELLSNLEVDDEAEPSASQESISEDIAILTNQIATLTNELSQKTLENEALRLAINTLETEQSNYQSQLTSLESNLTQANLELVNYASQVSGLQTQITNFENQVSSLNQTISSYQVLIDANNLQINQLNASIEELLGNKSSLEAQLQFYVDQTGPAIDFDALNQVSQLAVKANVKIDVGGTYGSGVAYKKVVNGNSFEFYILTNYHVIVNNLRYQSEIKVINYAGVTKTATLMAYQFGTNSEGNNSVDLAVIKVISGSTNEYYTLEFDEPNSNYLQQTLFSIGNPRGQFNTVTVGELKSLAYNVMISAPVLVDGAYKNTFKVFSDVYRHSALIDSGNSGGALINTNLKIVGINFSGNPVTSTFPFQSVEGNAIPVSKIMIFLSENNLN